MVPATLRWISLSLALGACGGDDARGPDVHPDAEHQAGFGRSCNNDSQCDANACVPHIGNTVCSQACSPDQPCPDNWTCWTPAGATNSEGSFCVSPHWSLCRPCSADADCSSISQDEPGACINYNDSGTFCGSDCVSAADCPEGFSCSDVQTRDGRQLKQCVNDSGMCECNPYIAALGENTRCATENEWGRCQGERTCDSKLWSRCDAENPAPDAPNLRDDDCDGLTDEVVCLCGDLVCDGNCGETLATCPCDCAVEGDGVCSPCGESPGTSPTDCCRGPGGTTGCGDGFCMGFGCQENPATCPQDCSTPCGNDLCEPGENPFNCAEDCKHEVCGNNICESSDGGPETCPKDCKAYCGDCICDPVRDESVFNCAIDCGYCGDGSCSVCSLLREDSTTCPDDCCVPSAEICNGVDDDCDGNTDEPDAAGCRVFYRDDDADGLGHWDDARCLCAPTNAWSAIALGDCDDTDEAIGAGADESCNDADDNCDGDADEDFDLGVPCAAPGGACFAGTTACDGPDRTHCVDAEPLRKGTICRGLRCTGGVIQPPSICDGAGQCTDLPLASCGGYLCDDGGRCSAECTVDADCAPGYACGVTGECELSGEPCTTDLACIDQDWTTADFCITACAHTERTGEQPTGDIDGDGIINAEDLCPETSDPAQLDSDGDGRGDACDRCEGVGSPEACNGLDDDCDGAIDDGLGLGVSCASDGNVCRVGVRVCSGGATACPAVSDAAVDVQCARAACAGDDLRLASRCDGNGGCVPGPVQPCNGFVCRDTADGAECTTTCSDDDTCAAGHHCAVSPTGGLCAPDLANGQACGSDQQCASAMCVDGVCCSTDCDGGCSTCAAPGFLGQCRPVPTNTDPKEACGACGTCGSTGACTNVPAGPSPKLACPLEPPCGGIGLCNSSGQCRLAALGTACDAASCSNGELTAGTTCDGEGLCRDASTSACPGELMCATAATCLARCTADRDCRVGNYCESNGVCTDLKPNGQVCSADRMCAGAICADGICCDNRCGGDCQSCAIADKLGTCSFYASGDDPESECQACATCNGSGDCGPTASGTDPGNDCAVNAPCGSTGQCNGSFGCEVTAAGVACGTAACIGTTSIAARQCDGAGSCGDPTITPCVGYVCGDSDACRTTCTNDGHCQQGFYCDGTQCRPKQVTGGTCARAGVCQSGLCADNFCCATPCNNLCETCAATPGTCTPLDNATDGSCSGDFTCESGQCLRVNGVACDVPGDCVSNFCVDGVCCNSSCGQDDCLSCKTGSCTAITSALVPGECSPGEWCDAQGECEAIAGSACAAVPGCPGGFFCKDGACLSLLALGATCGANANCASSHCIDGVCCVSDCASNCQRCEANGLCEALPAGTEGPTDCPAANLTCAADSACKLVAGQICTLDAECANNRCVDGKCCPTACNGDCQTCSSGACLGINGGSDPDTCAAPSSCFGANNCKTDSGTPCVNNGECASNICINLSPAIGYCCSVADCPTCSSKCDGECESCAADEVGECSKIARAENSGRCEGAKWCNAASVCVAKEGASCLSNTDCATGLFCTGAPGVCARPQDNGGSCMANSDCRSGLCVDGRCCENACSGACEACNLAGLLGRCELVPSNTTDDACAAGEVCSREAGGCAGTNGAECSANTDCVSGFCVDDVCCGQACDGICQSCSGGTCSGVIGETDQCHTDFACSAMSTCELAAGRACFIDSDCASGICSPEGICCDGGCDGPCERCELDGTCLMVSNDENFDRCDEFNWCKLDDINGTISCKPKGGPCSGQDDCASDYFCNGTQCMADLALGAVCTPDDDANGTSSVMCASGFCSGQRCCESACHGICEACYVPGFEGQCVPAPTYDDPSGLCGEGKSCNGPQDGDCNQDDGSACQFAYECISGVCDEGICCHKACTGVCKQCSADGQSCVDAPVGETDLGTCAAPHICDGGNCLAALGDACSGNGQCGTRFCADATVDLSPGSVCCESACMEACRNCNGINGRCDKLILQDEPECGPNPTHWCDRNGDCRAELDSPCDNDAQCHDGFYCAATNECKKKQTPGQSCSDPRECDTRFCSNGVCCSAPCNGPCDTCDTGGVCRLDAQFSAGQCVAPMQCDMRGNCTKPKGESCSSGVECSTGLCIEVDGTGQKVCSEKVCDGLCELNDATGHCVARKSGEDEACRAPFQCVDKNRCLLSPGQACGSDISCALGNCKNNICCASTCENGNFCSQGTGACTPVVATGVACTFDSQCANGNCWNGTCCGVNCAGIQPDGRCTLCQGGNTCTIVPTDTESAECNGPFECQGAGQTSCLPDN